VADFVADWAATATGDTEDMDTEDMDTEDMDTEDMDMDMDMGAGSQALTGSLFTSAIEAAPAS